MKSGRETVGASRFTLQTVFGVLLGIAVLYLGREVFIPIALALLLSFCLAPPMVRLQRWGVRKTFAALLVVALSFSALTLLCWAGFGQAYNLSLEIPMYRRNISTKLRSLTPRGLDHLEETQRMIGEISGDVAKQSQVQKLSSPQRPIPVEVREPVPTPLEFLEKKAGSILGPLTTALVVLVFVIFILLGREDLREVGIRLTHQTPMPSMREWKTILGI